MRSRHTAHGQTVCLWLEVGDGECSAGRAWRGVLSALLSFTLTIDFPFPNCLCDGTLTAHFHQAHRAGFDGYYLRDWQLQASNDAQHWVVLRDHKVSSCTQQ